MQLPEFTNLSEFIEFLAGPGAALVVLLLASYFLDGWSKWDALAAKAKQLIFLAASLLVGFTGLWLGSVYASLIPEVQASWNSAFILVYSIGAYVLVPQYVHRLMKRPAIEVSATSDKPGTVVASVRTESGQTNT